MDVVLDDRELEQPQLGVMLGVERERQVGDDARLHPAAGGELALDRLGAVDVAEDEASLLGGQAAGDRAGERPAGQREREEAAPQPERLRVPEEALR